MEIFPISSWVSTAVWDKFDCQWAHEEVVNMIEFGEFDALGVLLRISVSATEICSISVSSEIFTDTADLFALFDDDEHVNKWFNFLSWKEGEKFI